MFGVLWYGTDVLHVSPVTEVLYCTIETPPGGGTDTPHIHLEYNSQKKFDAPTRPTDDPLTNLTYVRRTKPY